MSAPSPSAPRRASAPEIALPLQETRDDEEAQDVQKNRGGRERKNLGMFLLMVVIVLWVTSNFLFYAIFSDDSYSKPYFVIYLNTATFSLYLLPWAFQLLRARRVRPNFEYAPVAGEEQEATALDAPGAVAGPGDAATDKLTTKETMKLSAEFCLLWFVANYFGSYCMAFTSVASGTVLGATSSIFTLLFSSLLRIERFTVTKLVTVLVATAGVFLVSTREVDDSQHASASPTEPALPPEKTTRRILLGDGMALLGAIVYGLYITLIKVRIKDERRINMQMFFGFVGLFNVLTLWPGLVMLDRTGIEKFELPQTKRVWWIVGINALITLISDYCWAYATLLTTPVIVTVGLSLTIPLALLGEMMVLQKFSSITYWIGASLVFLAFFLVNRESDAEMDKVSQRDNHDSVIDNEDGTLRNSRGTESGAEERGRRRRVS